MTAEFVDLVERAEVDGMRACVASARALFPELHAEAFEVAGGVATFVGPGSPLSEATGISARATLDDIRAIESFFVERATAPRVVVLDSHVRVNRLLAERGYVPVERIGAYFGEIARLERRRDPRVAVTADVRRWGQYSFEGFAGEEGAANNPQGWTIGAILASAQGATALEARDGETVVATAAMDCNGDLAGLFAASTLCRFRGRGWQGVLIADRIARAFEAGARYVRAAALTDSASERNFLRRGLVRIATRTSWENVSLAPVSKD